MTEDFLITGLFAVAVAFVYLIVDEYRYRKVWGEVGRKLARQHLRMAGLLD